MTRRQLIAALFLLAATAPAGSAYATHYSSVTQPTPISTPAPAPQPQPEAVQAAPVEERSFQEKAGNAFKSFRKGMAELGRSLTDF